MPSPDDFSKGELYMEAMFRKCADDPVFFFENFWRIQHPEHGAILFELFDAQRDALAVFRRDRYVLTLKSRQIGWTTIVASYAFWLAFFQEDRGIVFLSKGEREAKKILAKVTYGYQRLPEWMRLRGPRRLRDNLQEFPLSNGSVIESLPSGSDPARGGSAYLVIVDEWAFLEDQEAAWASIEPVTDVGGRCIGLSTANGWGNWFHTEWVKAETGVGLFTPMFYGWDARGDRDAAWYAAKAASLPEWQLYQEYPRTPEEAFIKSGNPFFDVDRLHAIETVEGVRGVILDRDMRTFVEDGTGPLEVWDLPEAGERYVIGGDVAEGLEWGDYSSAHVKQLSTGKVVAHWHGHTAPDEFGDVLNDLGRFYNRAFLGCENNNHGLTTCTRLKSLNYPSLFYTRTIDERTKRVTNKVGWSTTRKTRPVMLDDLSTALRESSLIILDRRTIGELRTFVRDKNGKLRGSPYDDRTISLAICEQMSDYVTLHGEVDTEDAAWGTGVWWDKQMEEKPERTPIGYHNRRR